MHAVVIHHRDEVTPEHCQSLADTLEITTFDARQRLICRGPVVVSIQADQQRAESILSSLKNSGFHTFLVDVEAAITGRPTLVVKNFALENDVICVFDAEGRRGSVAYSEIKLILPTSRSELKSESETVTQRKFSLGKTLMAGGIPMTKKVEKQETVTNDEREKVLYLCGGNQARLVCGQSRMVYEGFKDEMKPSREMNYNFFLEKVREKCPQAIYDERLMKRAEQIKLLGPQLNPENYIDLAVDILATAITPKR